MTNPNLAIFCHHCIPSFQKLSKFPLSLITFIGKDHFNFVKPKLTIQNQSHSNVYIPFFFVHYFNEMIDKQERLFNKYFKSWLEENNRKNSLIKQPHFRGTRMEMYVFCQRNVYSFIFSNMYTLLFHQIEP